MIDENDIEKALSWLVKNATPAAKARAERQYLEEYRKVIKAQLMKASGEETAAAQEREAYANEGYAKHLEALRIAVEDDERFRWLTTAAEAKIECWRSFEATRRAQEKIR